MKKSSSTRRQGEHRAARAQALATENIGDHVARALRDDLLRWYAAAKRDLPWRRTRDAYAIWLSEIMLQQTRVDTVVPHYRRFLDAFPTVHALAEAPLDGVLAMWSGLGYYRRARMLHAGAQAIAAGGGAFPRDVEGLRKIPGVGAYTAGAIASIAFAKQAPLVDGNVARVLARIFAIEDDMRASAGIARAWTIAGSLIAGVAESRAGDWNQALMELGATICTPTSPRCETCPAKSACSARALGKVDVLPRMKAKTKPIDVHRAALVAKSGGCVLLARRRAGGTFGGMWEPPSIDVAHDADARDDAVVRDAAQRFAAIVGARVTALCASGRVTHVLSHRRMLVEVFRGTVGARTALARANSATTSADYDRVELVDVADLAPDGARARARGITTFARKILHAAED